MGAEISGQGNQTDATGGGNAAHRTTSIMSHQPTEWIIRRIWRGIIMTLHPATPARMRRLPGLFPNGITPHLLQQSAEGNGDNVECRLRSESVASRRDNPLAGDHTPVAIGSNDGWALEMSLPTTQPRKAEPGGRGGNPSRTPTRQRGSDRSAILRHNNTSSNRRMQTSQKRSD
ncbi:hypothetical protein GOODEAATRI_029673, partial [Goodea atripinnis]